MAFYDNMVLYELPTDQFSDEVMSFMLNHGIECERKNVLHPEVKTEIIKVTGKETVPCLVVDGKPMYDALEIIDYLKTLVD